jgi:hypothetical protein
MNVRRKKEMYGKEQWLGPESNRHCLHNSGDNLQWKADADHLLPSLPTSLTAALFYCCISGGNINDREK